MKTKEADNSNEIHAGDVYIIGSMIFVAISVESKVVYWFSPEGLVVFDYITQRWRYTGKWM